jgi:hypothetical protein
LFFLIKPSLIAQKSVQKMGIQGALLLGVGLVLAGRIFAKLNTVGYLNYKVKKVEVEKQPFYKYLQSIPIRITIGIDNSTDEKLPFKGFEGTIGLPNIEPVPFRVVGTGTIPANASTDITMKVNVVSGALVDLIVSLLSKRVPVIATIKGKLFLGNHPIDVKADVNLLEYITQ